MKITLKKDATIEVTDEQYAKLVAVGAIEKKSSLPWRAEKGEKYWSVDSYGDITAYTEDNDKTDDYRYLTGNYFKEEAQAEAYKARQEAIGRVRLAILKANDGWEEDWSDDTQTKWYILYAPLQKSFFAMYCNANKYSILLPHIKSKEIAEQILADHEADLKIIFGVE
jgi:hypothetical protein